MVLTVHDIALMIHPTWGKWYNSLIQNTLARNSIRRADEIISVSKSTKRDLVKRLKVQPEKIRGIYEGRNELASYTAQQEREILEKVEPEKTSTSSSDESFTEDDVFDALKEMFNYYLEH